MLGLWRGRISGTRLLWGVVLLGAIGLPMEDAQAIPAFARKYNVQCTVCHTARDSRDSVQSVDHRPA
ncbi:MAG: hypothetical protein NNA24_11270, partial [Nitrospira sp.]|nr:hypothetical protein [Nitrospira sp.]